MRPHRAGRARWVALVGALAWALAAPAAHADDPPRRDLPPPRVRVLPRAPGAPAPVPGPRPPPDRAPGAAPGPGVGLPGAGPTPPPERPTRGVEPAPEDLVFEVERAGGQLRTRSDGEGGAVLVMLGNPRIRGFAHVAPDGREVPALSLTARSIVIWWDLARFPSLEAFQGLTGGEAGAEPAGRAAPAPAGGGAREEIQVLREAVLGIYAEGAVELVFGELVFRAERLHLEPRTYQALLLEPRFEARVLGREPVNVTGGLVPVYVRARQARMVAQGVAVFDDAEVSTSRADDRVALQVRRLTVTEAADEGAEGPTAELLGFSNLLRQRYYAEGTVFRAERIPLLGWPKAQFGWDLPESFPEKIKRLEAGRRSNQGIFGFLGVGDELGSGRDAWGRWRVDVGGYTQRGPSLGGLFAWDRPRTRGDLVVWGVQDFDPHDRNGYDAPDDLRWKVELESRSRPRDDLRFDFEYNQFSDRNVNLEYFERDQLEHKDRESYGRLRWDRSVLAATLTGKWHARDFVTETTQEPQLALWLTSFPLHVPASRGGLAIDLETVSRAGYLERRFDVEEPDPDYAAWRFQTDTRVNAAVDVGDVRLNGWVGVGASSYQGRTGGPDLTRTALLAGVRGNLQLHRTFPARGGFFQLDRLRHVIDVDVEYATQAFADGDEAPFFDLSDTVADGSFATLTLRNRLQTRGADGALRDVLDLDVVGSWFVDDVGPYGQSSPGLIDAYLLGEPRENVLLAGEMTYDFGIDAFLSGSIGVGTRPRDNLAAFLGFRYVQDEAFAPTIDVSWRWSEKYGMRIYEAYDFNKDENTIRLLFRRHSADHTIVFGFSYRTDDSLELELNLEPALGGRSGLDLRAFNDEPSLDPWRAFR